MKWYHSKTLPNCLETEDGCYAFDENSLALYSRACPCDLFHKDGYYVSVDEIESIVQKDKSSTLLDIDYSEDDLLNINCICGKIEEVLNSKENR